MSRNVIVGVAVVLLLVGGWLLFSPKSSQAPVVETQNPASTESAAPTATEGAMMGEEAMVMISSTGFTPKTITIKVGDSVAWENSDLTVHTVNSDPHPTHALYPFLNVGQLKAGEKRSVMFDKAGTYNYHDHLNPSLTGTVTVQ